MVAIRNPPGVTCAAKKRGTGSNAGWLYGKPAEKRNKKKNQKRMREHGAITQSAP